MSFQLDTEKAREVMIEEERRLDSISTADDLHGIVDTLQDQGGITAGDGQLLFVYPMSICQPDPLVVVTTGPQGLTLMGEEVKWSSRLAELNESNLLEYTLEIVEKTVDAGNNLLARFREVCDPEEGELHSKLRDEAEREGASA